MYNLLSRLGPYRSRYSGCSKFLLYAFSFFVPLAGFLIGLALMGNRDAESKRLGLTLLILAIVSTVLGCCVGLTASVLISLLRNVQGLPTARVYLEILQA
jgi:hypothetical protein